MGDTENAVVGCVSGIPKRLLRTCIPTRQSFFKEEAYDMKLDHSGDLDTQKANVVPVSPGIVARLMGLESLPEKKLASKYCLLDTFQPRRSEDSVYKPSNFDPLPHRQVRRSSCFRDVPIYLKDQEFFLFGAEDICVKKMHGTEKTKYKTCCGEMAQMLVNRIKTKTKEKQALNKRVYNENDYMRMLVTGRPIPIATAAEKDDCIKSSGRPQRKIQNWVTGAHRIIFPKKPAGQCSLKKDRAAHQSESPPIKPKTHVSAKDISRGRCSDLRCKRQLAFQESKFSPIRHTDQNVKSVSKMKKRCKRGIKLSRSVCYFKSKGVAVELANEDVERLFSMQVNIQDIVTEFEASILDGLVHEAIAELYGLYQNMF